MKNIAFTLIPLTMLTACSSELAETANGITGDEVQKVTVQSHPFEFDDDTRTLLTSSDKSINFSWADYDAMGVFPVEPYSNSQAKRTLSVPAGADAHYATFDGAGWELNPDNTYAAYVPYNGSLPSSTEYDEVPIDLTGQDGTLETIGKKYDYMYAPSARGTFKNLGRKDTEIVFDFEHVVSIVQLNLTMPVAATWKSVTLASVNGSSVWTTSATMNVATGKVTSKEKSSAVTLSLKNVRTTASNKTLTLYLAVLPTMTGDLTLTAKTSANKSYTATCKGKTFKAGKAYRFTTSTKYIPFGDGYENGYAYVNLGLSVKWATMNVGATSETDYGNYYAWGEIEPQASNTYAWYSYKWCNGKETYLTKYCTSSTYTVDDKTTLDPEDDAAIQNWGGTWRMPTYEEQEELMNNCYWVWTSNYNDSHVAGYIVYAAKSASDKGQKVNSFGTHSYEYTLSDSHIFLPAAGSYEAGTFYSSNWGNYYSSSLNIYENEQAHDIRFSSYMVNNNAFDYRWCGCSVRAVCK